MDTLFMNSENIKTPNIHRLLLNLLYKIISKRSGKCDKYVALSNLSIYLLYIEKKSQTKTVNLKYKL